MKIKMLHTRYGSEDGFAIKLFHKNEAYDVADSLAAHFIRQGVAFNNEAEEDLAIQEIKPVSEILFESFKPRQITNPATLAADYGTPVKLKKGRK